MQNTGEHVLALSLRAGIDKSYMVTNIEQFTEQFTKQEKWDYRSWRCDRLSVCEDTGIGPSHHPSTA